MNRNAMTMVFLTLAYVAVRDGVFTAPSSSADRVGADGGPRSASAASASLSSPVAKGGVTITLLDADHKEAAGPVLIAPPAVRGIHFSFCKS